MLLFAPDYLFRLAGQLPPGDPEFDLLRVRAGTHFGLPSPGHTTLAHLPGGNWSVDSFFDITYESELIGASTGPIAGQSGTTTATRWVLLNRRDSPVITAAVWREKGRRAIRVGARNSKTKL